MCPDSTYRDADLMFHGPKYGLGDGGRERKGSFGSLTEKRVVNFLFHTPHLSIYYRKNG
jgi:hypothetical protein